MNLRVILRMEYQCGKFLYNKVGMPQIVPGMHIVVSARQKDADHSHEHKVMKVTFNTEEQIYYADVWYFSGISVEQYKELGWKETVPSLS